VFIDETTDFELTAERLLWGKLANAGQTCLAPDYILCSITTETQLLMAIQKTLVKFYPMKTGDPTNSYKDLGRIVNVSHFRRLNSALERSHGTVSIGGKRDETTLFFQPTVVGMLL